MNSRTIAIWLFSEMKSNEPASIDRGRESRDVLMLACNTGNSAMSPATAAHDGMSSIAMTSSERRAPHGSPARQCLDSEAIS